MRLRARRFAPFTSHSLHRIFEQIACRLSSSAVVLPQTRRRHVLFVPGLPAYSLLPAVPEHLVPEVFYPAITAAVHILQRR